MPVYLQQVSLEYNIRFEPLPIGTLGAVKSLLMNSDMVFILFDVRDKFEFTQTTGYITLFGPHRLDVFFLDAVYAAVKS